MKPEVEHETIECAQCHEDFEPAWTDEEANAEAERLFGIKNASEDKNCEVICDDCFLQIFPGGKPI